MRYFLIFHFNPPPFLSPHPPTPAPLKISGSVPEVNTLFCMQDGLVSLQCIGSWPISRLTFQLIGNQTETNKRSLNDKPVKITKIIRCLGFRYVKIINQFTDRNKILNHAAYYLETQF